MTLSLIFISSALLSYCGAVLSLSGGAPTFSSVCHDLTQSHAPFGPTPCGSNCPFSLGLRSIDGSPVPSGSESLYRCGSAHRICIEQSNTNYRGFAVQSRISSEELLTAGVMAELQCGEFINLSTGIQAWRCPVQGVTHTNRNLETDVCFDWVAPSVGTGDNCTFWFSITRSYALFHSQLRGLDLAPDPSFCGSNTTAAPTECNLSCEGAFADANNQFLVVNCSLVGCTTDGYSCQLDDQSAESCTIPTIISLETLSIENHDFVVSAQISGTSQTLQSSVQFPNNPHLNCSSSTDGSQFAVMCSANFAPSESTCTCLLDENPLVPCDPYNGLTIDTATVGAGSHVLEIRCTHTASGMDAPLVRFSFSAAPTQCSLSCEGAFADANNQFLVVNCSLTDCTTDGYSCQLDDRSAESCTIPTIISLETLSIGNHDFVVSAQISGTSQTLQSSVQFPNNPHLNCSSSTDGNQFAVMCSANFAPSESTCTCLLDGNPFPLVPCDPYNGLTIDAATVGAGSHALEIRCTHTASGMDAPLARFSFSGVTSPPQLTFHCTTHFSSELQEVRVTCNSSQDLAALEYTCALNGKEITEGCGTFPYALSTAGQLGEQSFVITATDPRDSSAGRYTTSYVLPPITFLPKEPLLSLPTRENSLQRILLLEFAMLPETLQLENYTSTWTLPNGQRLSEESQSSDIRLLVLNGLGIINSSKTLQHTTLLIQGLSYSDAGVYKCSVQDNRNPDFQPIEGSIELQLLLTLTALNSRVTTLDNASSVELSCDMSNYIRPDEQLQWFKGEQLIGIDEDRRQITFTNGTGRAQLGDLLLRPSRLSVFTIFNPTLSDSGTYTCRVMGTRQSVDIELLVKISTDTPLETTHTTIIITLSVISTVIIILIFITFIGITILVVKRKKQDDRHLSPPQTSHDMDYDASKNNDYSEPIMKRRILNDINDECETIIDNYTAKTVS